MSTPIIDPEFQALIPPLAPYEYAGLERSLLADGCRDALVTWNGLLLDGHNRLEICQRHSIAFRTVECSSIPADREAAKTWIIRNQCERRNLSTTQRALLAAALATLERGRPSENPPIDGIAQARAAEAFSVGERTVSRARGVLDTGTPELIAACKADTIAISTAGVDTKPARSSRANALLGLACSAVVQHMPGRLGRHLVERKTDQR